jgi:predicted DNA-binding transcriptional regulator AlpA
MMTAGQFPRAVRLGSGGTRARLAWQKTDIDNWIADRIADSEPKPAVVPMRRKLACVLI